MLNDIEFNQVMTALDCASQPREPGARGKKKPEMVLPFRVVFNILRSFSTLEEDFYSDSRNQLSEVDVEKFIIKAVPKGK